MAPRGFHGISVGASTDVFLPIMMMPTVNPPARGWNTRHWWWLTVTARLKPGATLASATSEANVLWQQILKADPEYKPPALYNKDAWKFNRMVVLGGSGGWSGFRTQFSKPLTVLMIVVGLVLLIACANVANLLLARAAGRQKEIAVRLAIGAGRARLVCQLLMETLVVSVLGGLTGLLFAWWGVRVMMDLLPKRAIPTELNLTPDLRVLGFAFAASLLTGLICGLAPALQSTRPNLVTALKSETAAARRSRFDLRRILVVAQVAISLLLLIGAGLFVRSLSNLQNLDPGFLRESVLLVSVSPQSSGYQGQRLRDYYERLLAKVGAYPDVRAASLANITPLSGSQWNGDVAIQGYQWKPDEKPYIDFNAVSPHFFETLGIPLIAGRDFRDTDSPAVTPDPKPKPDPADKTKGPRVVIINETMAKRFFSHQPAIGARLCRDSKFKMEESYEIVGVVKDAKYFGLREATDSMIYVPVWRDGAGGRTLCLRTTGKPERVVAAVRREAAQLRFLNPGPADPDHGGPVRQQYRAGAHAHHPGWILRSAGAAARRRRSLRRHGPRGGAPRARNWHPHGPGRSRRRSPLADSSRDSAHGGHWRRNRHPRRARLDSNADQFSVRPHPARPLQHRRLYGNFTCHHCPGRLHSGPPRYQSRSDDRPALRVKQLTPCKRLP